MESMVGVEPMCWGYVGGIDVLATGWRKGGLSWGEEGRHSQVRVEGAEHNPNKGHQ